MRLNKKEIMFVMVMAVLAIFVFTITLADTPDASNTCYNCSQCEDMLNNNSLSTVFVGDNISTVGSCIMNPINFTNKILDCQDYTIDGDDRAPSHYKNTTGVVSYWYLDETTGGTATDSVGVNNGTLVNMDNDDWVTGKVNNALEFDGGDDHVDVGNDASLDITGNMTIELWFYAKSWDHTANPGLISKRDAFVGMDWEIYYDTGVDKLLAFFDGTVAFIDSGINPTLNQWHHLAITISGTTGTMYIDGISKGTDTVTLSNTGDSVRIGVLGNDTLSEVFNGTIDEVRIYNRSLSADEVYQNYLQSSGIDYAIYLDNKENNTIKNCVITGFERGITTSDSWTRLADMPERKEQHGFEELNGILYAVGGALLVAPYNSNGTYAYNISDDSWSTKAELPLVVQSPVLRAVNGKLYLIGGMTWNGDFVILNTTYEYDPSGDNWTQKADMPTAREDMGSAVVGDSIYVFGGLREGANRELNVTEVYNVTNDSWETKSDMPDYKWSGDFGVSYNNMIYLISSANNIQDYPTLYPNKSVYEYNISNDSFTQKADIPTPRAYKEVEEIDGRLYVMGGATTSTANHSNKNEIYDVSNDVWRTGINIPYSAMGMGMAKYNGSIYLSGGNGEYGNEVDYLYRFDPTRAVSLNITNNTILNCAYGIDLWKMDNSTIENNTIYNNSNQGIQMWFSQSNSILNNIIYNNTQAGINLSSSSSDNLIYNNNLTNNGVNAWDDGSTNDWNTTRTIATNIIGGPTIGGNWYSDYTGSDADGDGIGETTYAIGGGNIDYLPLTSTSTITFTWESPTPDDGDVTYGTSVYLNLTVTDDYDTSALFDWNYSLGAYFSMDYYNSTGVFDNSSYDLFGRYNGTAFDDNNITTGFYGKGILFDGVDDSIISAGGGPIATTGDLTIDFWFYRNTDSGGFERLVYKNNPDNTVNSWGVQISNTDAMQCLIRDGNYTQGGTSIGPGNWYHIVCVYDSTTNTVTQYLNGTFESSQGSILDPVGGNGDLNIGRMIILPTYYYGFNGIIDEVRIYDRVLSGDEINASFDNNNYRLQNNFTDLVNGYYEYKGCAIDTAGNFNCTALRNVTIPIPSINWTITNLTIGTVEQLEIGTNTTIVNSTAYNNNIIIISISGNGTFISANTTIISSIAHSINQTIQFSCNPLRDTVEGYYERIFNVSSDEDTTPDNITVICNVENQIVAGGGGGSAVSEEIIVSEEESIREKEGVIHLPSNIEELKEELKKIPWWIWIILVIGLTGLYYSRRT